MGADLVAALKLGLALLGPAAAPGAPSTQPRSLEVSVSEISQGAGIAAQSGDRVTIDFVVATLDGKEVANTQRRGLAYTVALGHPASGPFWETALNGARIGSERRVEFSSDAAFGPEGAPPLMASGIRLSGVVKILKIVRPNAKSAAKGWAKAQVKS